MTPISFYFWETDSPDFHLNRGFPGTVNTNKFTLNEEYDGSNPTREATFAGYALLSLYYTEAESTERYSQFPLIIEKFAFVRKYMKENYGIDLEAIAKGRMTGIFSLIQKYRVTTMKTVETMTILARI